MKGLFVPLVTPFYKSKLDIISLKRLISYLEPYVEGFVCCLSTGEGDKLSLKDWKAVINSVQKTTSKQVFIGLLGERKRILSLAMLAKYIDCDGIIVKPISDSKEAILKYFSSIVKLSDKPVVIYNTKDNPIQGVSFVENLDNLDKIIAIKDSSENMKFFKELVDLKKKGKIKIDLLQGMENNLLESKGCDGYIVSLANVNPKLCKKMLKEQSEEVNKEIMRDFNKYKLGDEKWYISLKEELVKKGILRSSEVVRE